MKISQSQYDVFKRHFSLDPAEWEKLWEMEGVDAYAIINELYGSNMSRETIREMNEKLKKTVQDSDDSGD